MKFECKQCGACCFADWWDARTMGIQITDEEINRIVCALGAPASSFMVSRFTIDVHPICKLFDPAKRKCKVHEVKPEHCKLWPNNPQMKHPANLAKGASICPGITLEPGDLPSDSPV